ncbi:MAG TPA: ATP-binding protein [Planctomycetota bacterium]|nr:ATP-binding protein [Planctomycetota bacterium]
MVDINYQDLIKQSLERARGARDKGDKGVAAKFYEQAAEFMMKFAGQSVSRESEEWRKTRALEYRDIAKKLRDGEVSDPAKFEAEAAPARKGGSSELQQVVSGLIYNAPTTWDDIGGLDETKREIKLTLGMSLALPPEGVRITPWSKILLFGPPGTGKTLLAAATSNAIRTQEGRGSVFFNVKISNILSKYFGESSKIVSELYGTARDASPSVIFLDEFESISQKRDNADTGAERRILSTLLSELDGLDTKGKLDLFVLTVAATNRPWDLDDAVLSRFEKMILVPLPDPTAREQILHIHLGKRGYDSEVHYRKLAEMTDGFSGRELERFCKQAIKGMIQEMNKDLPAVVDRGLEHARQYRIRVRPLKAADFDAARKMITPLTTPKEMQEYVRWERELEI